MEWPRKRIHSIPLQDIGHFSLLPETNHQIVALFKFIVHLLTTEVPGRYPMFLLELRMHVGLITFSLPSLTIEHARIPWQSAETFKRSLKQAREVELHGEPSPYSMMPFRRKAIESACSGGASLFTINWLQSFRTASLAFVATSYQWYQNTGTQ